MEANRTNWQRWIDHFGERSRKPLPALEADLDYTRLPRSLRRSLAVFQLGESGGGSVIDQARASRLPGTGRHYARAIASFVAEEHRHANLLAVCVRLMGGELLRDNWTARLFVFGRRLLGLRLKIMVLLAGEVVGLTYYELVAARLPPCRMRDWLLEIVADERDHLRFHCRFLHLQVSRHYQRWLFVATWRLVMWASERVVLLEHREALTDLSIERSEVCERWARYRQEAEAAVLGTEPADNPLQVRACGPS